MEKQSRPTTTAEAQFAQRAAELGALDLAARFSQIYETNMWSDARSRSGPGSSLDATAHLRDALSRLIATLDTRVLLDVPCGDFAWMAATPLENVSYIGADIVTALVAENQRRFGDVRRRFVQLDLTRDPLPAADVVLCRDCLVHLSYANVWAAIANIRRSGARYLVTTSFPQRADNYDIVDGNWRPLDLQAPPFGFPEPMASILEDCREEDGAYADKSLLVWRASDLPSATD